MNNEQLWSLIAPGLCVWSIIPGLLDSPPLPPTTTHSSFLHDEEMASLLIWMAVNGPEVNEEEQTTGIGWTGKEIDLNSSSVYVCSISLQSCFCPTHLTHYL